MSYVNCPGACAGKHKSEFDDPDGKRCRRGGNSKVQNSPKLHPTIRDPHLDCHCHEGKDHLPVKEPRSYDGTSRFNVVYEYGCFSVDAQRRYINDTSQLKFLHLPKNVLKLHMDLNIGYENVIKRDRSVNEKLDPLLRWISSNKQKFLSSDRSGDSSKLLKSIPVDFICFRGLLTTLLTTPYEKNEAWIICASKFRGTIYLCAFPTLAKMAEEALMTDRQKLMCAWGYKFEQYLTKSHPRGQPPSPETPVNENEEYCAVFKSKLNNHVLLYGAEVDGINSVSANKGNLVNAVKYIELKTSRIITTEIQDINFCKYKVLKWWAQCCLAAITKLYCGFRDDNGIVQYIRSFHLLDMPGLGEGLWSQNVCFSFTNCFLSFVKSIVVKDDPNVVYKFFWTPRSNVTYEELDVSDDPEYRILPEWYTSQFGA